MSYCRVGDYKVGVAGSGRVAGVASSSTSLPNNPGPRIGLGSGLLAVTSRSHEHGIRFTKFFPPEELESHSPTTNLDLLGSLKMTFLKSRLDVGRSARAARISWRRNGFRALRRIMQQKMCVKPTLFFEGRVDVTWSFFHRPTRARSLIVWRK